MTTRDMDGTPPDPGRDERPPPPMERQRRPPPQREGPIRTVLGREEAARDATSPRPVNGRAPSGDDTPVSAAVGAAYKVVENNVEEGRRAAERLRAAAAPPSDPAPDMRTVANRLAHITRELGATWIDLLAAALREPEVRAVVNRLTPSEKPRGETAGRTTATSVSQRVRSRKAVEVTLSPLPALDPAAPPGIAGLLSLDPASPPLRGVGFGVAADGGLEIWIEVPDNQPADVYVGAIVDPERRQPIGTLTVRVLE